IPTEIDKHNEWVRMLGVIPVIRALREKAMQIQQDTMDSITRKLPNMSVHTSGEQFNFKRDYTSGD
ncbi:hypothetical protein CYJ03_011520, partial [Staphylococcus pseudintermedius]